MDIKCFDFEVMSLNKDTKVDDKLTNYSIKGKSGIFHVMWSLYKNLSDTYLFPLYHGNSHFAWH